jgi:hypothetical protein
MASTTERGYGYRHQMLRRALLPFAYGRSCPKCGELMLPGQKLDLGHNDDRTAYTGMEHATCNRRDGAAKTNAIRRGEAQPQSRSVSRPW